MQAGLAGEVALIAFEGGGCTHALAIGLASRLANPREVQDFARGADFCSKSSTSAAAAMPNGAVTQTEEP